MTVCNKHILFDLSSRLANNDTIDSVLRHREVRRAKDLSAPPVYGVGTAHQKVNINSSKAALSISETT